MLEERKKAIMQKSTAQVICAFSLSRERQRAHIQAALIASREVLTRSIVKDACILTANMFERKLFRHFRQRSSASMVITACDDGNGGVKEPHVGRRRAVRLGHDCGWAWTPSVWDGLPEPETTLIPDPASTLRGTYHYWWTLHKCNPTSVRACVRVCVRACVYV